MEIFLAPKVAAKRAPTFQINVAVTNFAPERIVSDKRGSAADKCIRIETYTWHSRQLRNRGRKSSPQMTSNKKKNGEGEGCHHVWVAAMLVLQWRSCDCSRQAGKLRVRTEHLEVCRHFRAGISINVHHLCQYASYRRSACITGVPGRSGEGTAGRRRGMLRIAELNTWRSARKHADPEPSRGEAATVRGREIAACAAAGLRGERSYCKRRTVAPVLGRLRIAVRTEYLEVCRHSQPVSCLVFRAKKTQLLGQMPA